MKSKTRLLVLFFVGILVACSQVSDSSSIDPSIPLVAFQEQLPAEFKPGDVLTLTASGDGRSDIISFSDNLLIRLNWEYRGSETISIAMYFANQDLSVEFASQQAHGEGQGDWVFNAGQYYLQAESGQGQWIIRIEAIDYMDSPLDLLPSDDS